jgi:CRISPR system Cascade subunit CasE
MHALHKLTQQERGPAREGAIREAGASWLAARGATAGFSVEPERLHIEAYDSVRLPREGGRPVVFSTLTFRGVLTVDDPARFLASVIRGFGAAKAFGCGLMLIKRP